MKQTLKVAFYLKKNEADTNGTCPVMGRITVGAATTQSHTRQTASQRNATARRHIEPAVNPRKTTAQPHNTPTADTRNTTVQFSTKASVPLSLWDTPSGRARGKSKTAVELNRKLDKINVAINAHYRELLQELGQQGHGQQDGQWQEAVTAQQVKNAFQGIASGQQTLIKYYSQYNEDFAKRVGINREPSTLFDMQNSLRHLTNFLKKKYNLSDIPFTSLDMSFIESFDFYLRVELQRKSNTILGIMSRLRRMVRLAISEGIITRDPFDDYAPDRPKPVQKYLTREELEKIMNTPLDHPNRYLVRDLFLFACFTGLAYRDMRNLTEENIVRAADGVWWIKTTRQKTGTPCEIPLMELPLRINREIPGHG